MQQSKVKQATDIDLNNEVAPIALGGQQEVGGNALMSAPVSTGVPSGEGARSSDQGGLGSDPVEPLCARCRNLQI